MGIHRCSARDMRRMDVPVGADLLDALRDGRLVLAFQPVTLFGRGGADDALLYSEALLRRVDGGGVSGGVRSCADAIAALERLGWVDRLDFSVVWAVIGLLQRQPGLRLGCNVSAASLREEAWWASVLAYLDAHADIAQRLTLEITETSAITHSVEVMALVGALRECGVRIAIDDLGAGFTTFEFLARCRPDVVKIDRSVLLRACDPEAPPSLLRNLVQMCADHSAYVIVEGVETERQLEVVRQAGASAFQGYLLALPAVEPVWLERAPVVVQEAFES